MFDSFSEFFQPFESKFHRIRMLLYLLICMIFKIVGSILFKRCKVEDFLKAENHRLAIICTGFLSRSHNQGQGQNLTIEQIMKSEEICKTFPFNYLAKICNFRAGVRKELLYSNAVVNNCFFGKMAHLINKVKILNSQLNCNATPNKA